jgi:hypothetical protein
VQTPRGRGRVENIAESAVEGRGRIADVSGRLGLDDMRRMSIDQIARRMFAVAKQHGAGVRSSFSFRTIWEAVVPGNLNGELEMKGEDAFYRLVDRNLVRWTEGTQASFANYALTERGRSSHFADGAVDDPEPFVADVERKIEGPLDPVAREYLREAVAAYHDGRLLSAQFCLGAVAERVAFLVRDWIADLTPEGERLKKKVLVGQVVSALPAALVELRKARPDWESPIEEFADCLESCAGVYRRTRNEVGHPTEVRLIDDDEIAMMMSAMRRLYLPAAYRLIALAR